MRDPGRSPKKRPKKNVQRKMGKTKASPARVAAYQALQMVRNRGAYARDAIDKSIDTSNLSESDRAFALRLAMGVVQYMGTLDFVLNHSMRSPNDVFPDERDALRIATYEMLYLGKEPYAAVNEGVELVRGISAKGAGLANAVLRRVAALKPKFPFGDPKTEIDAYARLHGYPDWLAKKVISAMGPADAHAFLTASNEPAPIFIAMNNAKGSDAADEAIEQLVRSKAAPSCVIYKDEQLGSCYRLDNSRALRDGRIRRLLGNSTMVVSDAAAQLVANIIAEHGPYSSFLEIGAGRGTKTILLQSLFEEKHGAQVEEYVTVDNAKYKIKLIKERAEEANINIEQAIFADAAHLEDVLENRTFDCVFIDAPCTGLGTLRRHPEIRWRVQQKDVDEHAKLDIEFLASASQCVAPGGVLAYSTCTISPEENELAVKEFLKSEKGANFEIIPISESKDGFLRTPIGDAWCGSDSHFLALLRNKVQ